MLPLNDVAVRCCCRYQGACQQEMVIAVNFTACMSVLLQISMLSNIDMKLPKLLSSTRQQHVVAKLSKTLLGYNLHFILNKCIHPL